MTERLYNISKDQNETSNGLLNDIRKRSSLNRMYEKQSLALKKKLVEERKKAYDAASRKEGEGKGGLGFLRDLFLLKFLRGRGRGGGGFGRGGGRPPVGPTGGGLGISPRITPRNNIVPFSRGRVPTRLGGLSRVGPLAILGTGLDFTSRLGSGQNVLQASLGAGGGLAGALAGGAKGAALGSFAGPIGTLIGGVGGSLIGGIAGGSIADLLSGANRRRSIEQERVERTFAVTEFSKAQDDFDQVLDKFEGRTAPLLKSYKKGEDVEGGAGNIQTPQLVEPQTAPVEPGGFMKVMKEIGGMIAVEIAVAAVLAFIPIPGSRILAGLKIANAGRKLVKAARLLKVANNIRKLRRFVPAKSLVGRVFVSMKRNQQRLRLIRANATRNNLLPNRISRAVERGNFPNQSRVGIIKRQGANELLMTRIDNLLNSIRGKGIKTAPLRFKTRLRTPTGRDTFRSPIKKLGNKVDSLQDLADEVTAFKVMRNREFNLQNKSLQILRDKGKIGQREFESRSQGLFTDYMRDIRPIENITKQIMEGRITPSKAKDITIDKLGKVIEQTSITGLAEGGRVEAGKPYIVGEIGKELFVPDASGDILPNEDLGASRLVILNREPNTVIAPYVVNTSPPPKVVSTSDPYDIVAKYAQMTGLLTV